MEYLEICLHDGRVYSVGRNDVASIKSMDKVFRVRFKRGGCANIGRDLVKVFSTDSDDVVDDKRSKAKRTPRASKVD